MTTRTWTPENEAARRAAMQAASAALAETVHLADRAENGLTFPAEIVKGLGLLQEAVHAIEASQVGFEDVLGATVHELNLKARIRAVIGALARRG